MSLLDKLKKKKLPVPKPPEPQPESGARASEYVAPLQWKVGDRVRGRYQVLKILGGPGKSGMGTIYVCYDDESGEPVAIKTLQERFLKNKNAVDRFRWEAETWIRLGKHHNIVQALYVDQVKSRPFIFLEYVVGEEPYGADLCGWIKGGGLQKNGKPDLLLILNFAIQVCRGMIHAQKKFEEMKKLFIHRDLKPQNIIISHERIVKVTDFGLVKAFFELTDDIPAASLVNAQGRPRLSKSGNICGTPAYMSPEQCRGDKDIDVRSDIYSFGCVLFEMISGRYVFPASTWDEFMNHHLNTAPPLTGAHAEVDAIIQKCLKKDRIQRYADFSELEAALSGIYRAMGGEPVKEPDAEDTNIYELNNKGYSFLKLGMYKEATRCFKQVADALPYEASVHNNLALALSNQHLLDEAIAEFNKAIKLDPEEPSSYNNLGLTYEAEGDYVKALEKYKEALKAVPYFAETRRNIGNIYFKRGRTREALEQYLEALKINPLDWEIRLQAGNIFYQQGKIDKALKKYREALKINPYSASIHCNLSVIYKDLGQSGQSVAELHKALEIDPDHPEARLNLGATYYDAGRIGDAIAEYQEIIKRCPGFALARINLGQAYKRQGRFQDALKLYREYLKIAPPEQAGDIKEAEENIRRLQVYEV
jgi:eukaryotic-like serine/threonine-protein kinase